MVFRLTGLCLLMVVVAFDQARAEVAASEQDPAPPRNMGSPGVAGKGPVIDSWSFSGNRKFSDAELEKAVTLKSGTPLSASIIQPELEHIAALYRPAGGAYVQPSIKESSLNHVSVIFQIHEGVVPYDGGNSPQPAPAFMGNYWGNTMVCAAAQTGNDLCHMWLMKDGSFIIFDPNGIHRGRWQAGRVLADGRVPICRYWEGRTVQLPPEILAAKSPPVAIASTSATNPVQPQPQAKPGRVCHVVGFQMHCKNYTDPDQLSEEERRVAGLGMVERNREIGSCYSHGPHKVSDVWFEWDDYAPGQLGLDRQLLVPGHQ